MAGSSSGYEIPDGRGWVKARLVALGGRIGEVKALAMKAGGAVAQMQSARTGVIEAYGGDTAPEGAFLCVGGTASRVDDAALFAIIGTKWGAGDGSTTFGLPNFRGRTLVGYDPSQTEFDNIGETGGAKTHTLSVNEMPQHDHDFAGQTILWGATGNVHFDNVQAIAGPSGGNGIYTWQDTDGWADTYTRGGGLPHNNLQPYGVVNYIIWR